MTKNNSNFWGGLTLETIGGIVAARKISNNSRMLNSKIWRRILAEKRGEMNTAIFMAKFRSVMKR